MVSVKSLFLTGFSSIAVLATSSQFGPRMSTSSNVTQYPVRTLFEFGKGVWPENFFVRSNGKIVGGIATEALLYQFDPQDSAVPPQILHSFKDKLSVFGITETQQDLFYVIVNNFTTSPEFLGIQGTNSIWELDLRASPNGTGNSSGVKITKFMDLPQFGLLDGLDTLNAEKGLLVTGDGNYTGSTGTLIVVDTVHGVVTPIFNDTLLQGSATLAAGIDGIRVRDGYLYFTNAAKGIFSRFPIDLDTGRPTGPIETLLSGLGSVDDFFFDQRGFVYLCLSEQGIGRAAPPLYNGVEIIARLSGPTAARFGTTDRERHKLFVTSTGGNAAYMTRNFIDSSTLSVVDLGTAFNNYFV